jgi:LPXTG-site transpeptidase (sortase) family protein
MGFQTTQFKAFNFALLVFSFLSGLLGGAAVSATYFLESTLQQESLQHKAAVRAQVVTENRQAHPNSASEAKLTEGSAVAFEGTISESSAQAIVPEIVSLESSPPQGIEPHRITIPAINVTANVIDLGLNPDGTLEVPQNFAETGWWTGGARPGEQGASVIVGHFDSYTGPAIFYRLRELKPGDEVQVSDIAGQIVRFRVEDSRQVNKNAFPRDDVYGKTEEPTLRLITCDGPFNTRLGQYRDNLIVFASRIDD